MGGLHDINEHFAVDMSISAKEEIKILIVYWLSG